MPESFEEELAELYRSVGAELSGAKTVRQLRLRIRRELRRMEAVSLAGLPPEGRVQYKKQLGLMLFFSMTSEPAFLDWLVWRVKGRPGPLTPDEMIDEFLEVLRAANVPVRREPRPSAKEPEKQKEA